MYKVLTKAANLHAGKGRLLCLLLVAVVLIPAGLVTTPVSAQSPPGLPAMFYGTVTISGSPAAVGTVIQAQISSVVQGSFTVATAGSYGNMLVSNGNDGNTIQFYVNGVAAQTAIYHPGERNALALSTGGGGSAPVSPVLALPVSGATGASTTPTLQWAASSGAASYAVQVSTASTFATIAFSQAGISATSVAVSPALTAGTLYYWRANATNTYGTSAWTSAWTFTTATVAPPAAPVLLSPSNVATGVSTNPLLQWNPSTGATSYNVQVSSANTFASFVFTQSGSATAATVTPALSSSATYYWRANATGAGGTSSWSSTWSFTTAGSSPPAIPAFFKGTAYKNGAAVNARQVCAIINSGSTCATSGASGSYMVSATGQAGNTVTFTVDGSAAAETATYSPGWMTTLDLHAGTGVLAVTTDNGTYVNSTSATLSGTLVSLSSLDSTATPSIDYGPTTAYTGGTWTMSSMAPGVFTTPAITGLTSGQVIHFRAKAVGDTTGTIAYGSDNTYTHTLPSALSITTATPLTSAVVNVAYSQTFAATGGSGTGRTWTLSSRGTLPTVFTLSTGGVLTGTATSTGGPYSFTVQVNDSLGIPATKDFQLTVSAAGALSISDTSPLTAATVNVSYSKTFTASGGSGTGRTWTLSSRGTLPTVFTLSTGGVLTGTATSTGGPYSFTVQVNDSLGIPATKDFQLTVSPAGSCGADPIGCTVGTPYNPVQPYYVYASRYTATSDATINHINILGYPGSSSCNMTVAIYDDSSGLVGTLIAGSTGSKIVTVGLNTIDLASPITITSGRTYWLAEWSDKLMFSFANEPGTYAYSSKGYMAPFSFPSTLSWIYPGPGLYRGLISGLN